MKQLYGSETLTLNIHMHCHLISCMRDFGPMRTFWLFPFELYIGVLGSRPTNNRSIEIQLMRHFYKDDAHMQLANEAKHCPLSHKFFDLITDTRRGYQLPCWFTLLEISWAKNYKLWRLAVKPGKKNTEDISSFLHFCWLCILSMVHHSNVILVTVYVNYPWLY